MKVVNGRLFMTLGRLAALACLVSLGGNAIAQPINGLRDLEDVNKTMVLLNELFSERTTERLDLIVSPSESANTTIERISRWINGYSINLGYSSEECFKDFRIKDPKLGLALLTVRFVRDRENRFWYINGATIDMPDGEIERFSRQGFRPLALEYNFSDFYRAIEDGRIEDYAGLAPQGQLPVSFFRGRRLEATEAVDLFIKNILLHRGGRVFEVVFVELRYFPRLKQGKMGWLIENVGTMEEFYRSHGEQDPFLDYLISESSSGRGGRILQGYDLSLPSPYKYVVIRDEGEMSASARPNGSNGHDTIIVPRIQLPLLDIKKGRGKLFIEATGSGEIGLVGVEIIKGTMIATLNRSLALSESPEVADGLSVEVHGKQLHIGVDMLGDLGFAFVEVVSANVVGNRTVVVDFVLRSVAREGQKAP